MPPRLHSWAVYAWAALAAGAGLGFLARDLLGLGRPAEAAAWAGGALMALAPALRRLARRGQARLRRGRSGESGQATIEWTALALLMSLALGALVSVAPRADGRSFGGFLAHRIACAAKGGCRDGQRALELAYGESRASLVRAHAPNLVYEPGESQLPVDWRACRHQSCASAPDARDLDVHSSDAGARATVFTHVLRRGGATYIQYWLYYPDSNSTWAGSDRAWEAAWLLPRLRRIVRDTPRYPGFHPDDWESYQVRIGPDGRAWVRASSHGRYQSCKHRECRNRWMGETGWTRVSRGSHAGHIPTRSLPRTFAVPEEVRMLPRHGPRTLSPPRRVPTIPGLDFRERTSTAEGLRLIPLEAPGRRRYQAQEGGIGPPWRKPVYTDPESDES